MLSTSRRCLASPIATAEVGATTMALCTSLSLSSRAPKWHVVLRFDLAETLTAHLWQGRKADRGGLRSGDQQNLQVKLGAQSS